MDCGWPDIFQRGGGEGKRLAGGAGGGGVNSGNCAHLQCTRFCKQHVRVGRRYREEGIGDLWGGGFDGGGLQTSNCSHSFWAALFTCVIYDVLLASLEVILQADKVELKFRKIA